MSRTCAEQVKLTLLGWLATVATSLAFLPALTQQRCILIGAGLSAVVVAVGALLRLTRTPAIVVVLAQVTALAEVLVLAYGRHLKYLVLPTRGTLSALRAQLEAGLDVANQYAAPAPASVGLLILVGFFIALMAAFVDFFVVGLGRAPLAGLPLLALYTVPVAALPHGVPFYGFVPGAICFIWLLITDERNRLARWGRVVTRTSAPDSSAASMDTSGLIATGRRIGVLALLAAVFLPVMVPVLSTTVWGRSPGKNAGDGTGTTLTFNDPMVSLANGLRRPSPVDLLTVTSDISPQYLRLAVLDAPGPNAWSTGPLDLSTTVPLSDIPPLPTGMTAEVLRQSHSMSIGFEDAFPKDSAWLPVPYLLRYVNVGPEWGYNPPDQTVAAKSKIAANLIRPYDVSYETMDPDEQQLSVAPAPPLDIEAAYGEVPEDVPAVVGVTAQAVTAGAANDYERALLLQSYFRDRTEFVYDLTAGYGYGYEAMAQFLDERRGFCQHFAATMAMMARSLGIPSRVVVGLLQPERTGENSTYVFTSDNLHSWPELYFEGVGWVRFEPTQGVGAPYPQWAAHTTAPSVPPSVQTATGPTVDELSRNPAPTADTSQAAGSGGSGPGGSGSLPSPKWLIPFGALALLLLPAGLRLGVRRSRLTRPIGGVAAAESAWLELRDFVRDLRLPWTGSMTPRARQRSIAPLLNDDPEALSALQRLARCVERARYAEDVPAEMAPAADVATVMAAISRRVDSTERIRALLWPSSLVTDLREGWAKLRRPASRGSATRSVS